MRVCAYIYECMYLKSPAASVSLVELNDTIPIGKTVRSTINSHLLGVSKAF